MGQVSTFQYQLGNPYLFGRSYAFSLGRPYTTAALQYSNVGILGPAGNVQQPPSAVRVRFSIERSYTGIASKAEIEVFNLAQQTRNSIQKGNVLLLRTGYNGILRNLFFGNVLPDGLNTSREGSDIITSMKCQDGGSSIVMGRLDANYPPGVTLAQLLGYISYAMSLPTTWSPQGILSAVGVSVPNVVYQRGITLHGECSKSLDILLKPQGLQWQVVNGNLLVSPQISSLGQTAITINSSTGLIGTPSQNDQYTTFNSLLNTDLIPGASVNLTSENSSVNGYYTILTTKAEGDTHDKKWQVQCQCTQLHNPTQVLPASNGFNFNPAVQTA